MLSVEELVSSVKQRIPSKFQSWFGTAKSQNVKVVRKLSYWQSFLHGIWGGQPYMLRENIDNVLNPPVVRHCCVLSSCVLKPMPMQFSFACNLESFCVLQSLYNWVGS